MGLQPGRSSRPFMNFGDMCCSHGRGALDDGLMLDGGGAWRWKLCCVHSVSPTEALPLLRLTEAWDLRRCEHLCLCSITAGWQLWGWRGGHRGGQKSQHTLLLGRRVPTTDVALTWTVRPVLPQRAVYQPVGQPPAALQSKLAGCIELD